MAAHMLRALFLCFKFFPLVMDEEQEVVEEEVVEEEVEEV